MPGIIICDNAPRDALGCLAISAHLDELGESNIILPWATPHALLIEICSYDDIDWILLGQYRKQFGSTFEEIKMRGVKIFIHEFEGYPYNSVLNKWLNDIKANAKLVTRYYSWGSVQADLLKTKGELKEDQILVTGSARHSIFRAVSPKSKISCSQGNKVLIGASSNAPTPKMQAKTKEFIMYSEIFGIEQALDLYEIQVQNREHLLSLASILKFRYGFEISIRSHPFCDVNAFRELAKNYKINDSEVVGSEEIDLVEQLSSSDIYIHMGSTSSLEAWCLDKPIINLQTKTYCGSTDLKTYYSSSDFTDLSVNASTIWDAADICDKIRSSIKAGKWSKPKESIDLMFHENQCATRQISKDIIAETLNHRASMVESSIIKKIVRAGEITVLTEEIAQALSIKNFDRFIKRKNIKTLIKHRAELGLKNRYAPTLVWVKDDRYNCFIPIVEANRLNG